MNCHLLSQNNIKICKVSPIVLKVNRHRFRNGLKCHLFKSIILWSSLIAQMESIIIFTYYSKWNHANDRTLLIVVSTFRVENVTKRLDVYLTVCVQYVTLSCFLSAKQMHLLCHSKPPSPNIFDVIPLSGEFIFHCRGKFILDLIVSEIEVNQTCELRQHSCKSLCPTWSNSVPAEIYVTHIRHPPPLYLLVTLNDTVSFLQHKVRVCSRSYTLGKPSQVS
jgi:hypothetical protein